MKHGNEFEQCWFEMNTSCMGLEPWNDFNEASISKWSQKAYLGLKLQVIESKDGKRSVYMYLYATSFSMVIEKEMDDDHEPYQLLLVKWRDHPIHPICIVAGTTFTWSDIFILITIIIHSETFFVL